MEQPIIIGLISLSFIILLVVVYTINQRKIKTAVTEQLTKIATSVHANIYVENFKSHDFRLETDSIIYLFKIVHANTSNEIIMTNYQKWYLNAIKDTIKSSKAKRVIDEVVPFANLKLDSIKKVIKVAIIYPSAKQILRYINESEVIFVTPKTDCWGYKVINYSRLGEDFNLL